MMTEIRTGSCSGCQSVERLLDGACAGCRKKFGRGCGPIMQRVRSDPRFAKMCYDALKTDLEREKFVKMFGNPDPEEASG